MLQQAPHFLFYINFAILAFRFRNEKVENFGMSKYWQEIH